MDISELPLLLGSLVVAVVGVLLTQGVQRRLASRDHKLAVRTGIAPEQINLDRIRGEINVALNEQLEVIRTDLAQCKALGVTMTTENIRLTTQIDVLSRTIAGLVSGKPEVMALPVVPTSGTAPTPNGGKS